MCRCSGSLQSIFFKNFFLFYLTSDDGVAVVDVFLGVDGSRSASMFCSLSKEARVLMRVAAGVV